VGAGKMVVALEDTELEKIQGYGSRSAESAVIDRFTGWCYWLVVGSLGGES
jgi:hypothetical protein